MRNIFIGLFFLFFTFNLIAEQREVIRVATATDFPPFAFVKEGKLTGFDVDLLEIIGSKLNRSIKFIPMESNFVISSVISKITDLAGGGVSITQDRQKTVDFIVPYFDSGFVIVVRKDSEELDINQLKNKKIGTYLSDITGPIARTLGLDKNMLYGRYDFLFDELITGAIDAVLFDYPFAQYMISHNYKESLKVTGPLYFQHQYAFAVRKNYHLKKDIDKAIEEILSSPVYKSIYIKWFGD